MKRPRLRGQILLAREYLKTGVKPDWQPKDKTEELAFVAELSLIHIWCKQWQSENRYTDPYAQCRPQQYGQDYHYPKPEDVYKRQICMTVKTQPK